jgi:hypothetical protein
VLTAQQHITFKGAFDYVETSPFVGKHRINDFQVSSERLAIVKGLLNGHLDSP